MVEPYKNPNVLYEMYWVKEMNQVDIGNALDCNPGSVSYWMNEHGIETRSGSEALMGREIKVSAKQHRILTGILMSDGNANKESTTSIEVSMSNKKFMNWLNSKLSNISTGVRFRSFNDKRKDHYRINTHHLEEFNQYREWYSSEKKVWPDNIILYPETLKMLYVGDGTRVEHPGGSSFLKICLKNEHKNKEKINSMFEKIGVTPRWHGYSVEFTVPESHYLWNYMGSPPPGFKYKWPENVMSAEKIEDTLGNSVEIIDRIEPFMSLKAE